MALNFQPATRAEHKARVALIGPTGAGKTWTALQWAQVLAGDGGKVGVIDTENNSAILYADQFSYDAAPWFPPYDTGKLAAAFDDAARTYDVLIIDSLTHFWQGDGGVLEIDVQGTHRTLDIGGALIVATGPEPVRDSVPVIEEAGVDYVLAGDCYKPGDFLTCIRDGSMAALSLEERFGRIGS